MSAVLSNFHQLMHPLNENLITEFLFVLAEPYKVNPFLDVVGCPLDWLLGDELMQSIEVHLK